MSDTYGFVKLFFKMFWLAILCVATYFLFFYELEDYKSEIPEKYIEKKEVVERIELMNFTFYYSDGVKLVPEDRRIELSDYPAVLVKRILDEYIKGPENTDLFYTLPEKTIIRNYFLTDDVLYIDFSRDIKVNYKGGIIPELLAIYGVVNTVCQVDSVKKVKFLINGEDSDSIMAHFDTGDYITPNTDLIQTY